MTPPTQNTRMDLGQAEDAIWNVVCDWAATPNRHELLTSPLAYRARIEKVLAALAYNERCAVSRRVKDYAEHCYECKQRDRAAAADHCAFLVHEVRG